MLCLWLASRRSSCSGWSQRSFDMVSRELFHRHWRRHFLHLSCWVPPSHLQGICISQDPYTRRCPSFFQVSDGHECMYSGDYSQFFTLLICGSIPPLSSMYALANRNLQRLISQWAAFMVSSTLPTIWELIRWWAPNHTFDARPLQRHCAVFQIITLALCRRRLEYCQALANWKGGVSVRPCSVTVLPCIHLLFSIFMLLVYFCTFYDDLSSRCVLGLDQF